VLPERGLAAVVVEREQEKAAAMATVVGWSGGAGCLPAANEQWR
jgi:hypothetical protein